MNVSTLLHVFYLCLSTSKKHRGSGLDDCHPRYVTPLPNCFTSKVEFSPVRSVRRVRYVLHQVQIQVLCDKVTNPRRQIPRTV